MTYELLVALVFIGIVVMGLVTHIVLKCLGKDENNIFIVFAVLLCFIIAALVFSNMKTPLAKPVEAVDVMIVENTTCFDTKGDILGTLAPGTIVTIIGKTDSFWNWTCIKLEGKTYCVRTTDLEFSMPIETTYKLPVTGDVAELEESNETVSEVKRPNEYYVYNRETGKLTKVVEGN